MTMKYVLTEDVHTVDEKRYIFYGIGALEGDRSLFVIHDISADKPRMEHLVELCNRLELSPLHLWDGVEDFLAQ